MNKTGNEGGSVTIPLPDQDGFAGMAWWNNLTERERAYWAFLAKTGKGVRRLGTVQGLCRRGRGHGDRSRHTTVRRALLRGPKAGVSMRALAAHPAPLTSHGLANPLVRVLAGAKPAHGKGREEGWCVPPSRPFRINEKYSVIKSRRCSVNRTPLSKNGVRRSTGKILMSAIRG